MELYILKSAACLAIFFLFYKAVLENSTLHTIKRVFLLASLVGSLLIPLITFTETIIVEPVVAKFTESFVIPSTEPFINTPEPINYTPYILWSIYALGILFFSFRFIKNLFFLVQKIKKNSVFKEKSIWYVLLQLPVTPHSFFNYIFFDKEAYEAGKIPNEVIVHEQAHVTQKHSWDILFFEIFQIVFWFNPLLYFFKRSIKLNHEFLADRTVLNTGAPLASYQNILLDFSSRSSVPAMAHSINYSSIKKRFNVMKTHTSQRAAWLKGLLIIPLVSVLIYGFSSTQEIIEVSTYPNIAINNTNDIKNEERLTARSITIKILGNQMEVNGLITAKTNLYQTLGQLHTDITKTQRDRIMNFHVSAVDDIKYEDLVYIQKVATSYGYHRIVTPNEEIIRSKGNVPAAPERPRVTHTNYAQEYLQGASENNIKTFVLQIELSELRLNGIPVTLDKLAASIDKLTKDWEETDYTSIKPQVLVAATPKAFLDKVDAEFRKTHFSKANGGMNIVPPPPAPPKVSKGEKTNIPPPPPPIVTENKLAKNHTYSYSLYVNGKTIYLNGKKVSLDKFAKAMDKHTSNWPDSAFKKFGVSTKKDNASASFLEKLNKEYRKTQLAKKSSNINPYLFSEAEIQEPPVPPTPPGRKTPIDHLIAMAKRDATFFFEKSPITSDKAIQLVKENSSMYLQTLFDDPRPPRVYMSKNPIPTPDKKPKYETIASIKAMKANEQKTGYFEIDGTTYFFVKKGDDIKYYNKWGNLVNEKGEKIKPF